MSFPSEHTISSLSDELLQISAADILINLDKNKVFEIQLPEIESVFSINSDKNLLEILAKSQDFFKTAGILPLCLCNGVIEWEYKTQKVKSPLMLTPLSFKKNKITQQISFTTQNENSFFNPFLERIFRCDFEQPLSIDSINTGNPEIIIEAIKASGLSVYFIPFSGIGNFHYHRFHILRDLEEMIRLPELQTNVAQLIGFEDRRNNSVIELGSELLFPADSDHLSVFETVTSENCVIQGPPGTGKSQVLGNLIGKALYSNTSVLVVSEKRVALEVLQKKLQERNLAPFSFVATSETSAKEFIRSLEKVWNLVEESRSIMHPKLFIAKQYKDYLQMQLDLLSQKELVGGITFDAFNRLSENIACENADYFSDAPKMSAWLVNKPFLVEIYSKGLQQIIQFIPFRVLHSDVILKLDQIFTDGTQILRELQHLIPFHNEREFDSLIKKAAICQLMENESGKHYFPLLQTGSTKQKKFLSLRKKYLKTTEALLRFELEEKNWKEFPGINEVETLLSIFQTGSYWKKRKARKRFHELNRIALIDPVEALKSCLQFLHLKNEISSIRIEFCDLGVENLETELPQIDLLLHQIKESDWEIYRCLNPEERSLFCSVHKPAAQLKTFIRTYFQTDADTNYLHLFETLQTSFHELLRQLTNIRKLDEASYRMIGRIKTLQNYESSVIKSNRINFERLFPELAKFRTDQIGLRIDRIIEAEEEEFEQTSQTIQQFIYERFTKYHLLLQTPSSKLKDHEKVLKQQLKKGKSILIKEFSKTRNHPSIRELLQTEAREWIRILIPVWMMNPAQVTNCFPLEAELFDLVLFDEASQIPLSHALGSVQRGKRIVVAGDHQQMSPSSLFKSGMSEPVDLLHQAGFYWKEKMLKHHYRSEYPELIRFSNNYFYERSLVAYPSPHNTAAINLHYCENGIYHDQINESEALKIVSLLEERLKQNGSIGIVTFSQSQLECIRAFIPVELLQIVEDRIEDNTLFIKSLENVQGEECDHLLISLGYGKNNEGTFHLRFGPINHKSGTKRLNVLLTRAKRSIDFVCSVQSKDFKATDNEAIRLIKLFLHQIEQPEIKNSFLFPYGLHPEIDIDKKSVCFQSITETIRDVNELTTLHRVLTQRGWNVGYK